MSKTVHVISRETLSFSFCWYGVFFHLHCCTFQQETQNKIVQASFFGERNYDQVEKSIWECWHWPLSSFSPWLPLKMRYSKTLVTCRTNENIFLRRQERCWLFGDHWPFWIKLPWSFFCSVECFAPGFFCFHQWLHYCCNNAMDLDAQQNDS